MPDYNDNDDVNNEPCTGVWGFKFTPSTLQSSTSSVFATFSDNKNISSNSGSKTTAPPTAPPTTPSFFTPAPVAQPNNDKPVSGNTSFPIPYIMPVPSLTARTGVIGSVYRDGHLPSGGGNGGNGSDSDSNRQTPAQDINAAMIEANQEIRQRMEQQTQEAMTDRVRCLSKNSDSSSDKDRFLRSMHYDMIQPSRKSQQDDVVRQIALRVSRMLKEAEERGEASLDYHTLIAQEIVKEQQAGMLSS